ncbi:MAG: hypothetical protein QMC36_01320 [Patescibacteria group bacterium]
MIEETAKGMDDDSRTWKTQLNAIFIRNAFGHRITNENILVPITNELELGEILECSKLPTHIASHFNAAIEKLSDRTAPDYRNSIKEAISGVE